ncbi:MAG TPA: FABP family protein [Nocardioidaceae bacterium]|nr:FABP family protein [Nocardioidaceae bacterium]
MAFEIPADLHPDCAPIAWLLGTFRGSGHVDYPTIEKQSFGQEVIFAHDGRPFFHYLSRAWITDDEGNELRPGAIETGFIRPKPGNQVELVLAHATGFVEVWYGEVDGAKLELTTDAVVRTQTAKDYTGGHRLYGLVEGDLLWAFDMAAMGQPLQSHTWGRLKRG